MNHIFDPFNLVLIGVAALVFWRLKSVLGTRTGHERPPVDFGPKPEPQGAAMKRDMPSAPLPPPAPAAPVWQGHAKEGSLVAQGLEAIAAVSGQFSAGEFIQGAKLAYEIIVSAFASGDTETLKPLLAPEVFRSFSDVISARKKLGETTQSKLVAIHTAAIENAELDGRTASITVRFVSEFISARFSRSGEVLDGDPKRIREIIDVWTFERDVASRDPNWKLAATDASA